MSMPTLAPTSQSACAHPRPGLGWFHIEAVSLVSGPAVPKVSACVVFPACSLLTSVHLLFLPPHFLTYCQFQGPVFSTTPGEVSLSLCSSPETAGNPFPQSVSRHEWSQPTLCESSTQLVESILQKTIYQTMLFIYFCLDCISVAACGGAFSSCREPGLLSILGTELLIAGFSLQWSSLFAEHGL